jgi:hypothetical protein
VRPLLALAVAATALAACRGSAASPQPVRIVFGIGGGNVVPFQVVIAASGAVSASGSRSVDRTRLSRRRLLRLDRELHTAFRSGLVSRECTATNPDVGTDFITLGRRTVHVHGGCEPRFQTLWNTLARAVGLRFG